MKKTLLVGGAGFIGSAVLECNGVEDFTVFDNLSPVTHNKLSISDFVASDVDFIPGDVTQRNDIKSLFENGVPENLVLLAAETGTGRSLYRCVLNTRVNAIGIALILDTLSSIGEFPERIVLTSSRAVYGEGPYADPAGRVVHPEQRRESDLKAGRFDFDGLAPLAMKASDHLPNPSNIYGTTKLCQESLLRNWARSFNVDAYVLRLQNVYGAGQSLSNPYTGVLIHFLTRIKKNQPVTIFENGGITRDFVHVSDVANAISSVLEADGRSGTYDIGSGQRVALEAVASEICDLLDGPKPEFCDRYRLGDVRHAAADIQDAEEAFGYKPTVELSDGLRGLIKFFDEQMDRT